MCIAILEMLGAVTGWHGQRLANTIPIYQAFTALVVSSQDFMHFFEEKMVTWNSRSPQS